jgi:hypothetical protein
MSHSPHLGAVFMVVVLLVGATPALSDPAGEAHVAVDFRTGEIRASSVGHEIGCSFDESDVRGRLLELVDALARGQEAQEERVTLGRDLLGTLAPVLAKARLWRVDVHAAEGVPGPLAALPALALPWHQDRAVVASHHVLVFGWPSSAGEPGATARQAHAPGSGRLLLVAPFERGIEPAMDDPDTLRAALRAGAAHVDLLPRNESTPRAVRRALEDVRPALLWLRATTASVNDLSDAFDAFPPVVVWTSPSRESGARLALHPGSFRHASSRPSVVVVQTWAGAESARARAYRSVVDAMARGRTVEEAVSDWHREAVAAGVPPGLWAGWAVVGDPGRRVDVDRAPWLRRVLGPR